MFTDTVKTSASTFSTVLSNKIQLINIYTIKGANVAECHIYEFANIMKLLYTLNISVKKSEVEKAYITATLTAEGDDEFIFKLNNSQNLSLPNNGGSCQTCSACGNYTNFYKNSSKTYDITPYLQENNLIYVYFHNYIGGYSYKISNLEFTIKTYSKLQFTDTINISIKNCFTSFNQDLNIKNSIIHEYNYIFDFGRGVSIPILAEKYDERKIELPRNDLIKKAIIYFDPDNEGKIWLNDHFLFSASFTGISDGIDPEITPHITLNANYFCKGTNTIKVWIKDTNLTPSDINGWTGKLKIIFEYQFTDTVTVDFSGYNNQLNISLNMFYPVTFTVKQNISGVMPQFYPGNGSHYGNFLANYSSIVLKGKPNTTYMYKFTSFANSIDGSLVYGTIDNWSRAFESNKGKSVRCQNSDPVGTECYISGEFTTTQKIVTDENGYFSFLFLSCSYIKDLHNLYGNFKIFDYRNSKTVLVGQTNISVEQFTDTINSKATQLLSDSISVNLAIQNHETFIFYASDLGSNQPVGYSKNYVFTKKLRASFKYAKHITAKFSGTANDYATINLNLGGNKWNYQSATSIYFNGCYSSVTPEGKFVDFVNYNLDQDVTFNDNLLNVIIVQHGTCSFWTDISVQGSIIVQYKQVYIYI